MYCGFYAVKHIYGVGKICCLKKSLGFRELKFATMWHESRSEEKKMAGLMADRSNLFKRVDQDENEKTSI